MLHALILNIDSHLPESQQIICSFRATKARMERLVMMEVMVPQDQWETR